MGSSKPANIKPIVQPDKIRSITNKDTIGKVLDDIESKY